LLALILFEKRDWHPKTPVKFASRCLLFARIFVHRGSQNALPEVGGAAPGARIASLLLALFW
jgi:hypothetical protein